jgi:hypothetical protein
MSLMEIEPATSVFDRATRLTFEMHSVRNKIGDVRITQNSDAFA